MTGSDRPDSVPEQRPAAPLQTPPWQRAVLHVDMDCYFVAVERLDDPSLLGLPVAVGSAGRRGVVASASYEARARGVHSAQAMAIALRRCPDLRIVSPRMKRYRELSGRIMEVFGDFTPLVEPLSVDEAFLDVTAAQTAMGTPRLIARAIRTQIREETGLECAVGVAANKSVAKLASGAAKPRVSKGKILEGRGVVVVEPGREIQFLDRTPLGSLFGVGRATEEKLSKVGVRTVKQLRDLPDVTLRSAVGRSLAQHLASLSAGVDDRPVVSDREAKSISSETTFPYDLHSADELDPVLLSLADEVMFRVRSAGLVAHTINVKVRHTDFGLVTRSKHVDDGASSVSDVLGVLRQLLANTSPERGVRLLGVGAGTLRHPGPTQLTLSVPDGENRGDDAVGGSTASQRQRVAIDEVADEIRNRFGFDALRPARTVARPTPNAEKVTDIED